MRLIELFLHLPFIANSSPQLSTILRILVSSILFNPVLFLHILNIVIYCILWMQCRLTQSCHDPSWGQLDLLLMDVGMQPGRALGFIAMMILIQGIMWKWGIARRNEERVGKIENGQTMSQQT